MKKKKTSPNILQMLDEFRSIAITGLNHTTGVYDKERYKRMLELLSEEYAFVSGKNSLEISEKFEKELGYSTPKVGVNCAIINKKGKMLLEFREDDRMWGLLGGYAETGESPATSIRREVLEESGLKVTQLEMVDIITRYPGEYGLPHTLYLLLFLCEVEDDANIKLSPESLEISYQDISTISDWHYNHKEMAEILLKFWQKKNKTKAKGK